jgi:2-amino-4-hydroxy-6-hydroxymethyldihydropteridine diphosphokinase
VTVRCFVGLGGNVGDRASYLRGAVAGLAAAPGISVSRVSSIYESEPWGQLDQPSFLNAVVEIATLLEPIQLLITHQAIESSLGRKKRYRWGPREIDLDLLLYGDRHISRRGFDVPHPSMYQRTFVLVPLSELEPTLTTPAGDALEEQIRRLDPAGKLTVIQETALPIAR